jgi:O-antigen ligase
MISSLLTDRRARVGLFFGLGASVMAIGVGLAVAVDPVAGIALLAATVLGPAAVLKPKWVVYALVLTIHAEAVTVGGYTVGRLAAPLALVAGLSQALNAPTKLREARLTLTLVAGYVLWSVASLVWSVNASMTANSLGALAISLVYLFAFATIIRSPKDLRGLMVAVTLSSVLLALIWIAQYVQGVDRRYSSVGDPNYFAAYQVITLPLVVVLLSRERSPIVRGLLYLAIAIIADSVITTLSRGGFLVLALVLVLVALMPARYLFASRARKTTFVITCLVGLVLLLPFAWAPLQQRFQVGFSQDTNIAGDRGDIWAAALTGYREHPALGLGFGAFPSVSFQLLSVTPGVNLPRHYRFLDGGEYVHNAYIGSLAQIGPLGLLLFLGIVGATARNLQVASNLAKQARNELVRSVSNALLVGLVAFILSSVLLSTENSRVMWFLVAMGLALRTMALNERRASALPAPPSPELVTATVGPAS